MIDNNWYACKMHKFSIIDIIEYRMFEIPKCLKSWMFCFTFSIAIGGYHMLQKIPSNLLHLSASVRFAGSLSVFFVL